MSRTISSHCQTEVLSTSIKPNITAPLIWLPYLDTAHAIVAIAKPNAKAIKTSRIRSNRSRRLARSGRRFCGSRTCNNVFQVLLQAQACLERDDGRMSNLCSRPVIIHSVSDFCAQGVIMNAMAYARTKTKSTCPQKVFVKQQRGIVLHCDRTS